MIKDRFKVGSWEVRPPLSRIEGPEEVVHLEPKAIQVLCYLARHPRKVISRKDLLRVVWPDISVVDGVVAQAIFQLRRALGDDAKHPTFIETIPRKGYRLIAPVETRPGPQTARYSMLERLGERAMANLFLAEDRDLKPRFPSKH